MCIKTRRGNYAENSPVLSAKVFPVIFEIFLSPLEGIAVGAGMAEMKGEASGS